MPDANNTWNAHPGSGGDFASWFPTVKRQQDARLRLICFPYAGAGTAVFRAWPNALTGKIEVRAAHLPGRGSRLREVRFEQMNPLAETLTATLHPLLDRPFALFGHSLGALVAFEVARNLRSRGMNPEHLIVSGSIAPQIPDPARPIHQLPEEEFLRELKNLNGMPQGVLDSRELLEIVLPAVRSDFTVLETYKYNPQPPLDCPITVFGGIRDPRTTKTGLEGWRTQTNKAFDLLMLEGDHFFIDTARPLLLREIAGRLLEKNFASRLSGPSK
jgi:surfactin synthase thioesterase subunit